PPRAGRGHRAASAGARLSCRLSLEVELVFHRGFRVTAVASAAALTAFTLAAGSPALAGQTHAVATAGAAGAPVKVMLPTGDVVLLSTAANRRQTASVVK